ncbi:hypothetical protein B0H17DRAFT_1086524 [Mycena rosella]|uniref:Cysteine protease n=1 Tax=Mycena rosella TaxID=1033263 RepID=A0AAD7G9C7_MYCRO|nr:hypothetical protein B0H17DRAFT_1086524 [Mycena rosella]
MLQAGQSLLVTALQRVGAPPRRRPSPRARLLSWFLDAPSAPFGVHRMALAGKATGKDVGMWFGCSTAAATMRSVSCSFFLSFCLLLSGTSTFPGVLLFRLLCDTIIFGNFRSYYFTFVHPFHL